MSVHVCCQCVPPIIFTTQHCITDQSLFYSLSCLYPHCMPQQLPLPLCRIYPRHSHRPATSKNLVYFKPLFWLDSMMTVLMNTLFPRIRLTCRSIDSARAPTIFHLIRFINMRVKLKYMLKFTNFYAHRLQIDPVPHPQVCHCYITHPTALHLRSYKKISSRWQLFLLPNAFITQFLLPTSSHWSSSSCDWNTYPRCYGSS